MDGRVERSRHKTEIWSAEREREKQIKLQIGAYRKPSQENRGRKSKQGTNSPFTHSFSSFFVPVKGDLRGSACRIKWHLSSPIVATKGPIWSLCLVCPICKTPWRRTCFPCRYKRLILTGRCHWTRLCYVSEAVR